MANFAVPRFDGIQQAAQQYADTLTRVAMMKREERLRDEDQRTQALLGASTGDIATFVPEAREQLAAARTSEERVDILSKAAQLAQARSMQHTDLLNKAKAVGSGISATGMSDPAALADQQTALVTSGLPPDIIAQIQSSLSTQASLGSAEFAKVKEERAYRDTEQAEERGFARSENDRVFERNQRAQLDAEGRQTERQLAAEKRRSDEVTKQNYERLALDLGLPSSSPRSVIDEANMRSKFNEAAMSPQEMSANTSLANAIDKFNTGKLGKREGKIDDIVKVGTDLIQRAGSTGASLVPTPVVTSDGWFGTKYRIELKPWSHAQLDFAALEERAFEIDRTSGKAVVGKDGNRVVRDEDAAKLFTAWESAASTGKNRWLQRAGMPMTPEQAGIAREQYQDPNAPPKTDPKPAAAPAPAAPKSARDKGRGIGASVRRGVKALAPSAAGAERAARAVGESQRRAGESARQSNRRLKEGLVGVYEGLTGDE